MPPTIRTKLIVYTAVPVVIVYVVLLVVGMEYVKQGLQRDAKTLLSEHARHQATHLALALSQATVLAESLGDLMLADPEQSQELLYAHLIDGLRRTPLVNTAAVRLADPPRSAFMRRGMDKGRPLEDGEGRDQTPGWHASGGSVSFSRPIYRSGGRAGMTWVVLSVADLYVEIEDIRSPDIDLLIRRSDGLLLKPPHDRLPASVMEQPPTAGGVRTIRAAHDGDDYWLVDAQLPGFPWWTTAVIKTRTALAQAQREMLLYALGLLLSLLAIVAIIGTVARQITRPLVSLDDAVERISHGEFAVAPEVHSDDELGRLARAISRMAGHIADREQLLRDAQQVLEQRVVKRTSALQESNARLLLQIDETRKTQRALRSATDQAQQANRAKSEFLSNMSHELRTPLHGVLGYAQLLRRDPQTNAGQRENLQAIERCGQHLLTLINDILDLTRIEAGKMRIERQNTNLRQLIDDVYTIVAQRATQKGLALGRKLSDRVPTTIDTDPVRLRQILLNLLGNAVKFTGKGSVELTVDVDADGMLAFAVSDSGVGIPNDKLDAIFDAFQQASDGQAVDGTGLGLAINQRLIQLLDGEPLRVDSTPGRGSRFSFRLPLGSVTDHDRPDVAAELPSSHLCLAPGTCCATLIIDADKENRELLIALLRHLGCTVTAAAGLQTAGASLAASTFDLVLVDVRLPEPELAGIAHTLRKSASFGSPRLVAVSASVVPASDDQVLDAGFDGFLGKPFSERELRALLETLVGAKFVPRETTDPSETPWPTGLSTATAEVIDTAIVTGDVATLFQLAEDLADEPGAPQTDVERLALMARSFDFDGLRRLAQRLREWA